MDKMLLYIALGKDRFHNAIRANILSGYSLLPSFSSIPARWNQTKKASRYSVKWVLCCQIVKDRNDTRLRVDSLVVRMPGITLGRHSFGL